MDTVIDKLSGKTGKIIFSIPFFIFGISHFASANAMSGMVPVPGGVFWVYLTGLFLLAGAAGIATNLKGLGKLAAFLLGVLLFVFVFTIHLPGFIGAENEQARLLPMISLLKDIGPGAGAWVIAGTYK
jgi:uncharacterized membrane protein